MDSVLLFCMNIFCEAFDNLSEGFVILFHFVRFFAKNVEVFLLEDVQVL